MITSLDIVVPVFLLLLLELVLVTPLEIENTHCITPCPYVLSQSLMTTNASLALH